MVQPKYKYNYILIIDDNVSDVFLLKEILKTVNFAEHVLEFDNSVKALNFLKTRQVVPELIFIDLKMPGIAGFEFIKRFMNEFPHPTKFIIVTASENADDIKTSGNFDNVLSYFVKPISILDVSTLQID
jgi:two-component SAPR family response regulator